MLFRTHVAIGLFAILFFLPHVTHPIIFTCVALFSTMLPDIDSGFSRLGHHKMLKPLQLLTRHRGFFHSFTFCLAVSLLLALYLPVFALPFFLGYQIHLFLDSLTPDGIKPFWPFSPRSSGMIRVGGPVEHTLFFGFVIADIAFLFLMISQLF